MRLAIMGAGGRMGRALTLAALNHNHAKEHAKENEIQIIGGTEQAGSELIGQDLGEINQLPAIGAAIVDDPIALLPKVDAILDFTLPAATVEFAELSAQARIVHVIGTTGFTDKQEEKLHAASRHATIIRAGNMSLGVNLLAALTRKVSKILDEEFDIEIVEMHHKHKVDSPSGTALMLGQAAAEGRGILLKDKWVKSRDGQIGERGSGDIGFATLRGGTVIGDHTVVFAGNGERIELSHKADDRQIFAKGAVKAALWGYNGGHAKGPGFFSMADVLGID